MFPEINIGPLTLQTFGLCFALAFVAAGALVGRRLVELDKPVDWAYEMGFAALAGGLIGSRLYFVIENWSDVNDDPFGNIASGSGLVWYGGLIGGALAVAGWAWYRGFLGTALLDLAVPALALGQGIGRVGCQLSGDGDYGKAWGGPWAMAYPDGTVPTD
ncbi:MAG: prolipoprotein diacylglyceryl transferase, partial [Solirubrobacterales bacterium]